MPSKVVGVSDVCFRCCAPFQLDIAVSIRHPPSLQLIPVESGFVSQRHTTSTSIARPSFSLVSARASYCLEIEFALSAILH